jgi:hypothetical protein
MVVRLEYWMRLQGNSTNPNEWSPPWWCRSICCLLGRDSLRSPSYDFNPVSYSIYVSILKMEGKCSFETFVGSTDFLVDLCFDTEDGGDKFLRNVCRLYGFLSRFMFRYWRWRRHVPPKRQSTPWPESVSELYVLSIFYYLQGPCWINCLHTLIDVAYNVK